MVLIERLGLYEMIYGKTVERVVVDILCVETKDQDSNRSLRVI